ncbi:tyrosinase family protein [Flavobacterium sp. NRK F7]|uniref:tyrosinase family protein n=1 Tax=Flavobacterium sp. NRK F7 TaxID=2954930 RepID=UPI00209066BA|nr:tyrosinase family protein [Flavobacterium sp. NRK F7]MCO6163487.1 tyrosinase family protein [Flavobacterium sp. NRK F7]
MASTKNQKAMYDQVVSILDTVQGNTIPSYQGLYAFWQNPEVFLNASLYGQRLIAPQDGLTTQTTASGCCGSSAPATHAPDKTMSPVKTEGCCGSQETATAPIDSQPKLTSSANLAAPKVTTDCWPSGGSSGGGGAFPTVKRSDQSGIIIGLKGQYPFDGIMFPKLLWDTTNEATAEQIQFIANWIDSGCPLTLEEEQTNKLQLVSTAKVSNLVALARGEMLHAQAQAPTNESKASVNGLTVRKEISSLTAEELETFREAINCMNQYNDYWQDDRSFDYWARIHTNSCQHGWEQFLPWHRLYLYFFEQKLQDYNPNISLPYWSWTDYADVNTNTFNNSQFDLGVIPDAYGCFLTAKGFEKLSTMKAADGSLLFSPKETTALASLTKKGTIFNSGLRFLKAAGIDYEIINQNNVAIWSPKINALYTVLKEVNPLWFPNRWPGSLNGTAAISQYPTKDDIALILDINNFADMGGGSAYDHYFGALEKVHNGMHNFSGGTNPNYPDNNKDWVKIYQKLNLTPDPQNLDNPIYGWMTDNRTTAFDPLFWGHHSNVDRIWAKWQEQHNGTPLEMDAVMAPWTLTVKEAMSIQKLGYTYMRDSVFYPVSNAVGLTQFKAAPAQVSQTTLQAHRKAEIVLHRVQMGNLQNASIRVFLNTPDASVDTPITDNPNFVEAFSTFNGSCFGGPGHCNLPLPNTRTFDRRPLHNHEPRNYKIDASDAVQRVLNNGAKNITVQLVIVGLNGKPVENAVFIEGVSLNFMD